MNYEMFYEVLRDFRKGGLKPEIYDEFVLAIKSLPPISKRKLSDYSVFDKFGLTDISEEDFSAILREVMKRELIKANFVGILKQAQLIAMLIAKDE